MRRSVEPVLPSGTGTPAPVEGFSSAYDDHAPAGRGQQGDRLAVVCLHGWPDDRTDYRELVPLLRGRARLVVPDLRGFGESDKYAEPPAAYSAEPQARSVLRVVEVYGAPGAFRASLAWYRAASGSVARARSAPSGRITTRSSRSTGPTHRGSGAPT